MTIPCISTRRPRLSPIPPQTHLNFFSFLFSASILYVAYNYSRTKVNQTNLVFYVHDYSSGQDATAIPVAGKSLTNSNALQFGTLIVVDDVVTAGPKIESKNIGRPQGLYINSALDGMDLYLVFSVIFTDGPYRRSTLEIQGPDLFSVKEREFGVMSGTGFFRFVKGYGIMETEFLDIPNMKAVLKLNVTVKHH